jgi:hypothetical protein
VAGAAGDAPAVLICSVRGGVPGPLRLYAPQSCLTTRATPGFLTVKAIGVSR